MHAVDLSVVLVRAQVVGQELLRQKVHSVPQLGCEALVLLRVHDAQLDLVHERAHDGNHQGFEHVLLGIDHVA